MNHRIAGDSETFPFSINAYGSFNFPAGHVKITLAFCMAVDRDSSGNRAIRHGKISADVGTSINRAAAYGEVMVYVYAAAQGTAAYGYIHIIDTQRVVGSVTFAARDFAAVDNNIFNITGIDTPDSFFIPADRAAVDM